MYFARRYQLAPLATSWLACAGLLCLSLLLQSTPAFGWGVLKSALPLTCPHCPNTSERSSEEAPDDVEESSAAKVAMPRHERRRHADWLAAVAAVFKRQCAKSFGKVPTAWTWIERPLRAGAGCALRI